MADDSTAVDYEQRKAIFGEKGLSHDSTTNGTLGEPSHAGLMTTVREGIRRKRVVASLIVVGLVLVGIIVGAVVGTTNRRNTTITVEEGGGGGGQQQQPSFPTDPRLHNSFWGIAYSPYGSIDCTATQANVTRDMKQLSQLTTRLRLYAADCNVTSLILQAIEDLHVNMSIYAGIFVNPDEQSYASQVAELDNAYAAYGPSRILGVTVGNEYLLNAQSRGDTVANATTWLISRINDYKAHLQQLTAASNGAVNYTSIPVGTSDAAGTFISNLATAPDYLFVNIHAWFSQNTYQQAAWFAWSYMQNIVEPLIDPALTSVAPPGPTPTSTAGAPATTSPITGPELFQGEIGWPTASDSAPLGINAAGSPAGIEGLQTFLDDWVCGANRNDTRYFWFEAYDEPWKAMYGGVEQHWGLFDAGGNLKNITIPDCSHS